MVMIHGVSLSIRYANGHRASPVSTRRGREDTLQDPDSTGRSEVHTFESRDRASLTGVPSAHERVNPARPLGLRAATRSLREGVRPGGVGRSGESLWLIGVGEGIERIGWIEHGGCALTLQTTRPARRAGLEGLNPGVGVPGGAVLSLVEVRSL